ncbi:excisionase family DNA-binding protein [Candidatus Kaiserbacteria bacterium]|nr:excisionase family DNA-binding protein [Candidatus Kaiserbacteria bacterium]
MSDEIFFDGARYISATEAAELANLSRDYVARLCKEGRLSGKRVGKHWYVNRDSLQEFVLRQEHARAKRRDELTRERREEYRAEAGGSRFQIAPRMAPRVQSALVSAVQPQAASFARAISSAPLQAASLGKQVGAHALPPLADTLHKLVAIVTALLFTVGTYLFVDAQYARLTAQRGFTERASLLAYAFVDSAGRQLALAAENPAGAFSSTFEELARFVNRRVDALVYNIMFPQSLTGLAQNRELVSVRVVPRGGVAGGSAIASSGIPAAGTPSTRVQTIVNQPVIERVVETQRIVSSAGGLTEEILTARLNQLDSKLTSQIYAVASVGNANSTTIVNHYNAVGGALRIDQLDDIDLNDSDIVRGRITNSSITNSSVSATTLSASGATSLAGTTVTGNLAVTGTISGAISSSVGTFGYITATSTTATSTFASGGVAIGTTSPSANSLFTVGTSSPLFYIDRLTGRIGIGTSVPTSSAALQIDSTAGGFLPPRVSTAQKTAINSAAAGLVLYDTDLNKLNVYNGSAWKNVGSTEIGGEVTNGTQGSVLFIGDGTVLGQDATNFMFSTSTNRLLVTQASSTRLSVFEKAYFGGSATSTFDSTGFLTLPSGFLSQASSTIGGGGQATGLTIFGGATTTSLLVVQGTGTSTFSGNISVTGNINLNGYLLQDDAPFIGSQWTTSGSNIYYNTGNVGIGTSSPTNRLEVAGNTFLGGNVIATGTITSTSNSANTFPYASSTALTVSGTGYFGTATSTWLSGQYASTSILTSSGRSYFGGQLTLTGTAANIALGSNYLSGDGGDEGIFVDSDGDVGIGTTDSTAKLNIASTGANPTIYNPTSGAGIILRGVESGFTGQLRIVPNNGGWTDATSTTYFQITSSQNDNATFMGGTWGADRPLNRLQYNASSTQFTDLAYTSTPVPFSLLGLVNSSAPKPVLTLRGATSQTGDFLRVNTVNATAGDLFKIDSSGRVGIGTTSPYAKLSVVGDVVGARFVATTSIASEFPFASSTALSASGTGYFGTASTTNLTISGVQHSILSSNGMGVVSASTTIGWNLLKGAVSSIFAFDENGAPAATTSIGANLLSGSIANAQLANSSVTVNSAGLLTGGGSVSLGGTLTLNASTSPTVGYVFATSTIASTLPYASSTALTVNNTSAATTTSLYVANLASATTTASRIAFLENDLSAATTTAAITSILQQNFGGGKGDLTFSTLNAGTLTEALRITSTGSVGIGTTSPGSALSIQGVGNFSTATSTLYGTGFNIASGASP